MMGRYQELDWIMDHDDGTPTPPGVGGRQPARTSSARGGGYLDICSSRNSRLRKSARDPRLEELAQIGLDARWLRIADVVGVDQFLEVWQILDEENIDLPPGEREPTRIRVPLFAGWMRLQRNKLVQALADEGRRPPEIRRIIRRTLCESLSERHITRIIGAATTGLE